MIHIDLFFKCSFFLFFFLLHEFYTCFLHLVLSSDVVVFVLTQIPGFTFFAIEYYDGFGPSFHSVEILLFLPLSQFGIISKFNKPSFCLNANQ